MIRFRRQLLFTHLLKLHTRYGMNILCSTVCSVYHEFLTIYDENSLFYSSSVYLDDFKLAFILCRVRCLILDEIPSYFPVHGYIGKEFLQHGAATGLSLPGTLLDAIVLNLLLYHVLRYAYNVTLIFTSNIT